MMIRRPIPTRVRMALGASAVLLILLGYAWMSHRSHQRNPNDMTIPNGKQFVEGWKRLLPKKPLPPQPSRLLRSDQRAEYLQEFGRYMDKFILANDLLKTFWRLTVGIVVGVALSVVIGIAMGCFPVVEAFFAPPLTFFAKIPPTAMLAVYFVIFGTQFELYVAMIALGVFPTLAQSVYQAAKKDVTDHAIYKARTLGASQMEVIWNVIVPQILPRIIENVRLQIGPAMIFLIAAEWVNADVGFGYRLRIESRLTRMSVVYTYLALLGAIGFVIDFTLSRLRRKLSPWFGE